MILFSETGLCSKGVNRLFDLTLNVGYYSFVLIKKKSISKLAWDGHDG